jgi:hypothetical protein
METCDTPETDNGFGGGHTLVACRHGHTTKISAFTNGLLHIKWGEDDGQFKNISGIPEEISQSVDNKDISCNHTIERKRGWGRCGCKLKIIAGQAETPQATFIKTKTRVGDIWDRNSITRPSEGIVDADGKYHPSEHEKRHTKRLREIRKGNIKVYDEKSGTWKVRRRKRNAKPKGSTTPTTRRDSAKLSKRQAKDHKKYD